MKLKIRLKALEQDDSKEIESSEDSLGGIRQLIISLIAEHRSISRPPVEVLEEIWKRLKEVYEEHTEVVLKITPCGSNNWNKNMERLLIREFSETDNQAHRLTAVITTLRLMIQHLRRKTVTTLRDIYYRDVSAFHGSQRRSNDALQLWAATLNCSIEKDFKIFPSPKGLIFGGSNIKLVLNEDTSLNLRYDGNYTLIPSSITSISFENTRIDAFVVTEKEAVFKSLSTYLRVSDKTQNIVMLTGKGNPDKASMHFTRAFKRCITNVPFLIFVDSDVYGLRILWMYVLAAGGPCSQFIFAGTFLLEHQRGYLTIARREWKLSMNFLREILSYEKNMLYDTDKTLELMKRELKRGMLLGVKAELNVICATTLDDGLNAYLWHKIAATIGSKT